MAGIITISRRTSPATGRALQAQSQWALAWGRFSRNRFAVASLFIIAAYMATALLAPLLAPHNPVQDHSGRDFLPPFWQAVSPSGKAFDPVFPLGTDQQGRDVLSRLIYGTRTSLVTGVLPVTFILVIGLALGFLAGFKGGFVDNLVMRTADIFFALPAELFLIILMVTLGTSPLGRAANGLILFLSGLAVVSWTGLARLMRASALQLRETEFVSAARSMGAGSGHIIQRHILPNSMGVIVVWVAFAIPRFIIAEAILGFIGLGLRPSLDGREFFVTSWGRLFLDAYAIVGSQPGFLLAIAIVASVLVISFTFVGDGLRDALDPKTARK